MDKKTWWVFGDTSEYAGHIINRLEQNDNTVVERFNRSNTDYSNPAGFLDDIENKELPDRIFFNANIQANDFDYGKPIVDQYETYRAWLEQFQIGFWFKLNLLEYLKDKMNGVFIFSSSGIALDQTINKDCKLYRLLRASELQLMYTYHGHDNFVVCGACVSDMTNETKEHYASIVAQHMIEDRFKLNCIYTIFNDGNTEPHMVFKPRGWVEIGSTSR